MVERRQRPSELLRSFRAFWRNRTAVIGIALLFLILLLCFVGPLVMKHDPTEQDLRNRYAAPV